MNRHMMNDIQKFKTIFQFYRWVKTDEKLKIKKMQDERLEGIQWCYVTLNPYLTYIGVKDQKVWALDDEGHLECWFEGSWQQWPEKMAQRMKQACAKTQKFWGEIEDQWNLEMKMFQEKMDKSKKPMPANQELKLKKERHGKENVAVLLSTVSRRLERGSSLKLNEGS